MCKLSLDALSVLTKAYQSNLPPPSHSISKICFLQEDFPSHSVTGRLMDIHFSYLTFEQISSKFVPHQFICSFIHSFMFCCCCCLRQSQGPKQQVKALFRWPRVTTIPAPVGPQRRGSIPGPLCSFLTMILPPPILISLDDFQSKGNLSLPQTSARFHNPPHIYYFPSSKNSYWTE